MACLFSSAIILVAVASAGPSDASRYSFSAGPKSSYTFYSAPKSGYSFSSFEPTRFEPTWIDTNGIDWSAPIRITRSSVDKDRPSIIETPSLGPCQVMTKWVFWHSGSPSLYYAISHDAAGISWTLLPTLLTNIGSNYRPAPAVIRGPPYSSYSLWLVWGSARAGSNGYDIYNKSFSEVEPFNWQWSADKRLDCNSGDDDVDPSIIQASDGTIWIAWASNTAGNYDICLANSVDGGLNWNSWPAIPRLEDNGNQMYPSLAEMTVGSSQRIWIAYQSDKDGDNEINCAEYDPIIRGFMQVAKITNNAIPDEHPTITRTRNGDIWIAWDSDGEIYYTISSDGGLNWTPPVNITNLPSAIDRSPWITQTWDGKVWVVWSTKRSIPSALSSNFEIYAMYGT